MLNLRLPIVLTALFAAAAVPPAAPVAAQTPTPQRQRVYVSPQGEDRVLEIISTRRGRLGITVSLQPEATDSLGALVQAVTPGGPAARAGLQSGDVVAALDGQSIPQLTASNHKSSPGVTLVELVARHGAGDTVRVTYQRGQSRHTVRVVLEEMAELAMSPFPDFMDVTPDEGAFEPVRVPPGFRMAPLPTSRISGTFFFGAGLGDLELAPMNPGLGQYFGTADGVLVVNAPEATPLNLKPGDVILAVDGRRIPDPATFFRVIRSYTSGESFRIDLMRMKRKMTVQGKVGG
ncbi:MAG: PDZ domain-containing protein [Gemmatimonadales bacterium]